MFNELPLNLVSYNCRGLKLHSYYERLEIESLLDNNDIVCLQETWLAKQQEDDLKGMRSDYNAVSNSPNDDSLGITAGRKKEGVAILWKNSFDKFIIPHKYEYDWVVSVEIVTDNKKMYVFNVYLPCDKTDNEVEYQDRLAKLHNLIDECDSTCVTVVGDFNANVTKNANFAVLLNEFCNQFKYTWSSRCKLPIDTYTYVSDAWGSHSWLDHCISTEDGNRVVTNIHVLYGCNQSDHIPVSFVIDVGLAPVVEHGAVNSVGHKINWSDQSEEVVKNYGVLSDVTLGEVNVPAEVLQCKDCNCNNVKHKEALNEFYKDIMDALTSASQSCLNTTRVNAGKNHNRPGWRDYAADLYEMSHETYFVWKDSGGSRHGVLFDVKNRAKARFKSAMRFLKRNEDSLRKDSIAKKLLSKNDKEFWKEIKIMNNSKLSLPNTIDSVTVSQNIVNMWKSHYEDLFNCLRKEQDVKGKENPQTK